MFGVVGSNLARALKADKSNIISLTFDLCLMSEQTIIHNIFVMEVSHGLIYTVYVTGQVFLKYCVL